MDISMNYTSNYVAASLLSAKTSLAVTPTSITQGSMTSLTTTATYTNYQRHSSI
ncbi:hypothetical protein PQ610_06235 [Tardisphaera miroshnichenkoae]